MFLWSASWTVPCRPRSQGSEKRLCALQHRKSGLSVAIGLAFASAWLTLVIVALVAIYYSFEQITVTN